MANRSRVYLKNVFKQNAVPTEQNFADLIDSYYNTVDDKLHLDHRGLVIGKDYKQASAAENGLLVQGKAQLNGGLSLETNGITITGFSNHAELGTSSSTVPTQSAVKTYVDKKADLQGNSNVPFSTQNLAVSGYLTFDGFANQNGVKVSAISTDSQLAEVNHQTLMTQQAIKESLDVKAHLHGDLDVDFSVNNLQANTVTTKSLVIEHDDLIVIMLYN